jgi:hypothetical protein
MMDNQQILSALPITLVQTPQGPSWYIPHAQRYASDFVAQRRYQAVGTPQYVFEEELGRLWEDTDRIAAHWIPYLNPGAVQAAGLDLATIMAWSVAHPNQIFTHPTYAALCLRWGENAFGYTVTEQAQEPVVEGAVPFTPHTCWLTGTTYYQVGPVEQEELLDALCQEAALTEHLQELGLEGTWRGWYTTDLWKVKEILAARGQRLMLANAQLCYGVCLEVEPVDSKHWIGVYATAEEASMLYQSALDAGPTEEEHACLKLLYGFATKWPGRELEWHGLHYKNVSIATGAALLTEIREPLPVAWLSATRMRHNVAEIERPLARRILTVKELLDKLDLARPEIAQALAWPLDKLLQGEDKPWELTLTDIRQVAWVLRMSEDRFLKQVKEEQLARYVQGEHLQV